jgi:hypothetical protein
MSEERTVVTDNFENGYFWALYGDLEGQFEDFLEYVPYMEGNEGTYSFRLLNLILGIGGHIDSAFKEMVRYSRFAEKEAARTILKRMDSKELDIVGMLGFFENELSLSKKSVTFRCATMAEQIAPFESIVKPNGKVASPRWWPSYNKLKHDVGLNIKYANLKNARDALAGAFLLNVVHLPAYIWFYKTGVLKPALQGAAYFKFGKKGVENLVSFYERKKPFGFISTPLFTYDYSQKSEE